MQFLVLITLEWRKWAQRPVTWAPLAIVVVLVLGYTIYLVVDERELDMAYVSQATAIALSFPALFTALVMPAVIMSYEWHHGTIRYIRIRPVRRGPLLMAKGAFAFAYGVAILIVTAAIAWTASTIMGGNTGVTYGDELLFTSGEMYRAYAVSSALFLAELSAATAFSLAMGTVFRSPGAAITAAIGGWLIIDIAKYPLGIESFVFFTHWDSVWIGFSERANGWAPGPQSWMMALGVAAAWWAVCVAIAYVALRRSEQ